MTGIWLLPSRRRLEKLQKFFDVPPTTPGVILVQREELAELKEGYAALKLPEHWSVLPTKGDGLGDKCREVWNAIKNLDWVGLGCDDLRPVTEGWDQKLLEKITGKNIVTCNDGQQGHSRMAGITIFSGRVLRAMGYMFPPDFWHTYVDNVWEDIGRLASCWTYVDSVLVRHDHPFRNQQIDPSLADETTMKSYGQQERDMAAYNKWLQDEREKVVIRVRAIQ